MYDICIICFNEIDTDARVLNMLNYIEVKFANILLISLKKSTKLNPIISQIEIQTTNNSLSSKWFSFNYQIAKLGIKSKFVIACDFFSLPAAVSIKKNTDSILIYDSREIYSALGSLQNKQIKQWILSKIELHFARFVDKIIVTGQLDKNYLEKYFQKSYDYHIIMNVPFLREKANADLIRFEFNISNSKKILLYQGAILDGRGIMPIVDAIKDMNDIVFLVIGDGPQKEKYFNESIDLIKSKKVFFAPSVNYSELHNWTCSADIGTALFEPISLSYNLALPNKLFEYIMAEIPVVATDLPAIRNIWSESEFGCLIDKKLDKQEIKDKINHILVNSNYLKYLENTKKLKKIYNYEQINNLSAIFSDN